MDPSSYTPPTPTVVPASAPPADAPANPTSENELTYDEMICLAVATLDNGKGSTKNAIGNFMVQTYDGLHSNHNEFLTERLNVLTRDDRLVMVKRSYKLPDPDACPSSSPRKRGRPCKRKLDELPPDVPLNDNPPETRGRPLKIQKAIPVPFAPPPDSAAPAFALPPSGASPQAVGAGSSGGVRTPQDSPGSAAGRSKKVTPVEEELRRKLEHFQSKVSQYIRDIKPCFSIDSKIKVIEAIQGLERLAKMDLDGPLPNETQEPPPQK